MQQSKTDPFFSFLLHRRRIPGVKKFEKKQCVVVESYEFEDRNITKIFKILSLHGIFGQAAF